jgi:hypothetical protein
VVENLPPEPQRAIRIPLQPKNVVETQPLLPLGVVENLPLGGFLLRKSKKMVEIRARFQKMWSKIDHLSVDAAEYLILCESVNKATQMVGRRDYLISASVIPGGGNLTLALMGWHWVTLDGIGPHR